MRQWRLAVGVNSSCFCVHQKWLTDVELKIYPQHRTALRTTNFHKKNISRQLELVFLQHSGDASLDNNQSHYDTSGNILGLKLVHRWTHIAWCDTHKNIWTILSVRKLCPDWILADLWAKTFFILDSDEHWWWNNLHKYLEVHQMRFAGCQCYWQDILRSLR